MFKTIHRSSASLLLSCLVLSQPAHAENIKVVSMVTGEGVLLADNTGFYAEIYSDIIGRTNVRPEFEILPFKRALRDFATEQAACIWGLDAYLLLRILDEDIDLTESALVMTSQQYLFTRSGSPDILTMSDVQGKAIGVLSGGNAEEIFGHVAARIVTLPDQEAKIRMLMANRIDAIGAWVPDIYITMGILGIDRSEVEPSLPISSSGIRMVCHKSPLTDEFISSVNIAISAFVGSDNYERIFDDYGIPQAFR